MDEKPETAPKTTQSARDWDFRKWEPKGGSAYLDYLLSSSGSPPTALDSMKRLLASSIAGMALQNFLMDIEGMKAREAEEKAQERAILYQGRHPPIE